MSVGTFMKESFSFVIYFLFRLTHKLPQVSSIYFHDPSPELFESILKWYRKHHYRFISLQELEQILESKRKPKDRLTFISFDDGKRGNLNLLPICEKYNVPITVFVATEPLESGNYWWEYVSIKMGWNKMLEFKKMPETEFYQELARAKEGVKIERTSMTIDELRQFAKHPLVTIQSHTENHPVLTNLTDETLYKELKESKRQLEELTGETIDVFSYPNGDVGQREIEALKATGYKYAFTTQALDFDVENLNPYLLPRMAMNTDGGKYENLAKLTAVWYKIQNRLNRSKN